MSATAFETVIGDGCVEYSYSVEQLKELVDVMAVNGWKVSDGVVFHEHIFGPMSSAGVVEVVRYCEAILKKRVGHFPTGFETWEPLLGDYILSKP